MENQNSLFGKAAITGFVILLAAAAVLWLYLAGKKPAPEPAAPIKTSEEAVEAVTSAEIDVNQNPVNEKVPEVNPVDRANPFKDAYKNPFE